MPWLRRHFPFILSLLVLGLFMTRALWATRGYVETHDGLFHIIRLEEMTEIVRADRQFPPRYAPRLDNGFGLPLFNYTYPGPYYLGLPLTLTGMSAKWAIKLVTVGLYLLGILGMYLYHAHKSRPWALAAAGIFMTIPYVLVNIFVRGALGEFMAIMLMPWVVLAARDMAEHKRLHWYHPVPYFLLFLAHNFVSFLFLPVYGLYIVSLYRTSWKVLTQGLLLSLGLAMFFVGPMLSEKNLITSGATNNFTYSYTNHFVYPEQLIWSPWGNGPSLAGKDDGMSFQLGVSVIAVIILSAVVLRKKYSTENALWWKVVVITIFFVLPISGIIWRLVKPVQIIQFPWRLLSFVALAVPMLVPDMIHGLPRRVQGFIMALLLTVAFYFGARFSTPPYIMNNEQFADQMYIHRYKTTTSSRNELLPKWVTGGEKWRGDEDARAEGPVEVEVTSTSPSKLTVHTVTDDSDARVTVRRHYFPSWGATNEKGESISLEPGSDGEIILHPESGDHTYRVAVGQTRAEHMANAVTLATLCFLIGREIIQIRKKHESNNRD